ncbi:MAG: hypothetical protein ABSE80_12145 [Halobacteriota archaeon]|jgi:hypothetical protein
MSLIPDPISYTELTFPDHRGKSTAGWFLATFSGASYTLGGIPANIMKLLDVRTMDFNGELKVTFYGEDPYNATTGVGTYRFIYSPVTDTLQLVSYITGLEVAAGAAIPTGVTSDTVLVEVEVDRTTVRG